jgi:hypothetical protein
MMTTSLQSPCAAESGSPANAAIALRHAAAHRRAQSIPRCVVVMADGVSLRNFVLGGVLGQATMRGEVYALHSISDAMLPVYQRAAHGVTWMRLPQEHDGALTFTLRNALSHAHVTWADTVAGRYQGPGASGSWRRDCAVQLARLVGRMAASPKGIRRLQRLHEAVAARTPELRWFQDRLRELRPSLVFCTKQTSLATIAPVLAARSLGIPTATFIFSWDNLTTKGHIAAPFDHFLVWGDRMREELLRYYPNVAPSNVHVVGSPQFDFYARRDLLLPREEFLRSVGADPARPVICYSGGDAGTCPEDPDHVRILLELARAGGILGNPQVLLRPMPVDDGRRYDAVRRAYPELILVPPAWVHDDSGHWAAAMPLPADARLLLNLVRHASVNVNVASTMTLDFAINDKPVVNIAFDVGSPPPLGRPLWHLYYEFDHYRPVVELGAARVARSPGELAEHVNAYLADPSLDHDARRRLVRMQLEGSHGQSAERVADVLFTIAS